MTWFIGIDEAGYGPNLGPFVMTAVACRVPKELAGTDLWSVLRRIVRREGEKKRIESRILVADSKVVYSPKRGLKALENGVLSTVFHHSSDPPTTLDQLLERFAAEAHSEVRSEPWYCGVTCLPFAVTPGAVRSFGAQFQELCGSLDISWAPARVCAICPTRFNRIVAQWGTKGEVSGQALRQVLPPLAELSPGNETIQVSIDKHGGRNHYAALLQHHLADGMVMAREEGPDRSFYDVFGLGRQVRFTFEPRADSTHFCVALASMISKYLRELLMHEFNAYWQTHVPGLKPTAGYPTDAVRYWREILPAVARLGLVESAVWRWR